MKPRQQKSANRTSVAKREARQTAPAVRLASGPVTPAEAKVKAKAMRAAIEAVFDAQSMAKIAAVVQCQAMNGDLQAVRMMWDYYGIGKPEPEAVEESQQRSPANVVQVNVEGGRQRKRVRVLTAEASQGGKQ